MRLDSTHSFFRLHRTAQASAMKRQPAMRQHRPSSHVSRSIGGALLAVAAFVVAGCGGGGDGPPAASSVTVGGTLSGLAGTVVLRNNGKDDLTLTADGTSSSPAA